MSEFVDSKLDYIPLDLEDVLNSTHTLLTDDAKILDGVHETRGIPIKFCGREGKGQILLTPGCEVQVEVPERLQQFRTLVAAHRIDLDEPPHDADLGKLVGSYSLVFDDGEMSEFGLRAGYEIATLPSRPGEWGEHPALAFPADHDTVPARTVGPFDQAGYRQTEVVAAGSFREGRSRWRWYLWFAANPRTDSRVVQLTMRSHAAPIAVGAVTVGFLDEHPFRPEPARPVVAAVPPGYESLAGDLQIDVDRGSVGYTFPTIEERGVGGPLAAWGRERSGGADKVYARVAAVNSATVRLMAGDHCLAEQKWPDLGEGQASGVGTRLWISEESRNWIRTVVVDAETGHRLPCRVNFSSPEGVPYQPHGHHNHVNSNLGTWHVDVGGDVRLGDTTYAYVDGKCEGWLPRGPVSVQVSRGFEYESLDDSVFIEPEQRDLTIRLRRSYDSASRGWYSGDTHVHFVSSLGGLREAAAEDLSVVNLLISQWGSLFTNVEDFVGRPVWSEDGKRVLFASQENRQHFLGHLSLLGLKETVAPMCSDGPNEAEMGSGLEATLSDWADRCHEQGGTVVIPHFPYPKGETATLVATGRADAAEMLTYETRSVREYYRYLNAGFRLPIAGGTDKMSSDVPVGLYRTYVRIPGEELTYESWCRGLAAGRSYLTSGPLVEFSVDGHTIGDTVQLPRSGGTVEVAARAESIFPLQRLELVHKGMTIASAESAGERILTLREAVPIVGSGWLCVRVTGGNGDTLLCHRDAWARPVWAHTSPIYIECGDEEIAELSALTKMREQVLRGMTYVSQRASVTTDETIVHHHGVGHRSYLLTPFNQALTELDRRIAGGR